MSDRVVRSGQVLELLAEVGVSMTYRQLDYWCRLGLFAEEDTPTIIGSGYRRAFTIADIEVAIVIAKLSEMGGRFQHMMALAVEVRRPRPSRMATIEWEAYVVSPDLSLCSRVLSPLSLGPLFTVDRSCWLVIHDRGTVRRIRGMMGA